MANDLHKLSFHFGTRPGNLPNSWALNDATMVEINNLATLGTTQNDLDIIGDGIFEIGAVCNPWNDIKNHRCNCIDCIKKNFLHCIFNNGSDVRQNNYMTLTNAGNPTFYNNAVPNGTNMYLNCAGWQEIPQLLALRNGVVARIPALPGKPWRVECHFHIFLIGNNPNTKAARANDVQLTFRMLRDLPALRKNNRFEVLNPQRKTTTNTKRTFSNNSGNPQKTKKEWARAVKGGMKSIRKKTKKKSRKNMKRKTRKKK